MGKRVAKVDEKDKLKVLNELVPWENVFRERARQAFGLSGGGGRPSFDELKMFKVLVLQRLYGLSDEEMEFSLNDRLSFQRFVGFGGQETIPDEKTIWLYRERLTQSGKAESLFKRLEKFLIRRGYAMQEGVIVDATVIELPGNGTDRETYKKIKAGEPPQEIEPNAFRRSQIDFDARYTSKDKGKTYVYGYKAHTRVCAKHKLIQAHVITEASVNEPSVVYDLLQDVPQGTKVYGDSAYDTLEIHKEMRRKGLKDKLCKQSLRNKTHSVTGTVQKHNSLMARVRRRIEHVYGHIKHTMHGGLIRCVGAVRARTIIIMNNLAYNLQRYAFLERHA